ncbi:MAG: AhpC/TSA family protein [Marinifilaceae bacterium]|jgi:peroxiredoxin|nr:AhpC/TSA family protein [Marinifilaceae bacterium]
MKKSILFVALAAMVLLSCTNKPKYDIHLSLKNSDAKKVYIGISDLNKFVIIDSAEVKNGKAHMSGSVVKTQRAYLFAKEFKNKEVPFYIENSRININLDAKDFKSVKIKGGNLQAQVEEYIGIKEYYTKKFYAARDKYNAERKKYNQNKDPKLKDNLDTLGYRISQVFVQQKKAIIDFIRKYNSSPVAIHTLSENIQSIRNIDAIKLLESFTGDAKKSSVYKSIDKFVKKRATYAVGSVAPDFEMNTPEGKPFKLSSLRGKVVIMDIWASWCGPCRAENPNVKRIYKKFHKKGLEVLSVSLDDDKSKWVKAIKEDGLNWHHVSELNGWKSKVVKLYGVRGVPHIVIIDKKGVIVAKNLRDISLEKKIEELLK